MTEQQECDSAVPPVQPKEGGAVAADATSCSSCLQKIEIGAQLVGHARIFSLLLCIRFNRAAFAYCSGNGTAVVPDNRYFTCTMTSVKGCWKNPTDGVTRSPYGEFVCYDWRLL